MILPMPSSWDAVHPVIVHFPIGLLLIVPLFLALGAVPGRLQRGYAWSAFLLMLTGSAAAWAAVSSGGAARELVTLTEELTPVLLEHERLAELSAKLFSALTLVYGAIMTLPGLFKKEGLGRLNLIVSLLYLGVYLVCCYWLVWAGHFGGWLVHEFGVRAML
jgi:uncharacterized membrane protein